MEVLLLTFVFMLIIVLGMSIGVLFGRSSIRGSCGGANRIKGVDMACPACSGAGSCKKEKEEVSKEF